MKEFAATTDLMEAIRADRQTRERFKTRFILVRGHDAWQSLLQELRFEVDDVIQLSTYCRTDDVLPYTDDCLAALREGTKKRLLLLPFGESLRFDPDAGETLRTLAEWQSGSIDRLYVPILECESRFWQVINGITRFRASELPEIWSLKGSKPIRAVAAPFPVTARPAGWATFTGMKAWFQNWEQGGSAEAMLISEWVRYVPDPEYAAGYVLEIFREPFDIVAKQVRGIAIDRELGSNAQWRWLANQLVAEETFDRLACRLFNVKQFDAAQLFALWSSLTQEMRWLLWLWSREESPSDSYLRTAIQHGRDFLSFSDAISTAIFSMKRELYPIDERNRLLDSLRVKDPPPSFWQAYRMQQDPLEQLAVLTNRSEVEREASVLALGSILQSGAEAAGWWDLLENGHPCLAAYLTPHRVMPTLLRHYFALYAKSRIQDHAEEELFLVAEEEAAKQSIWQFPTRDSVLERLRTETNSFEYWVDAMGLEWLNLLVAQIEIDGDAECEVRIGHANLPTTTEQNRGWEAVASSTYEVNRNLDTTGHHYDYQFPRSFCSEMDIICVIGNKVRALLDSYDAVIVTADHGLTRFAQSGGTVRAPEGAQVKEFGRFAEVPAGTGMAMDAPASARWIDDGGRRILLTHHKMIGGGSSGAEVHGGATFEESLVPVIIARRSDKEGTAKPSCTLEDATVHLSAQGEGSLSLVVKGSLNTVELLIQGRRYAGVPGRLPGEWHINVSSLAPGSYQGTVECERGFVGMVAFEVVRGIKEVDLGI